MIQPLNHKKPVRLAGAILAGGCARRLQGVSKGTLRCGTDTIVGRLIRQLKKIDVSDVVIVANERDVHQRYGLQVIGDRYQQAGPLAGVEAALGHFADRAEGVLFVPCDLPCISKAILQTLVDAFMAFPAPVVFAEGPGDAQHPLCAVVHTSLWDSIVGAIGRGHYAVHRLWDELHATRIKFAETDAFMNVNDKMDLALLDARGDGQNAREVGDPGAAQDVLDRSIVRRDIQRLRGHERYDVMDQVVAEEVITVMVDRLGSFTIMCTPQDLEALAVGFVFAEGLIDDIRDVISIHIKENVPDVVGLQVQDPTRIAHQRNMVVASSCGLCGVRSIQKLRESIPPVDHTLKIPAERAYAMVERMQSQQVLFHITGATHAAAIFDGEGRILTLGEDLGRHTALDKAIGKCLLQDTSPAQCGVALSGRVSMELVIKAARAGIELICAVSAPSSLAIQAADHWGITLCGFVRSKRANVYTHPARILPEKAETVSSRVGSLDSTVKP